LSPNQTYRDVVHVTPASSEIDLRQQSLIDNLGRLVDNQPESIIPATHPDIATSLDPSLLAPYIASRATYKMDAISKDFPPISTDVARSIFPLVDPLDLDIVLTWKIRDTERSGQIASHGIRLGPEFSKVENLRRKIEAALLSGGKQTRTMYEETGRLRKLLLDSVLDGALAKEDDPLVVRGYLDNANAGVAQFDLAQGYVLLCKSFEIHTDHQSCIGTHDSRGS